MNKIKIVILTCVLTLLAISLYSQQVKEKEIEIKDNHTTVSKPTATVTINNKLEKSRSKLTQEVINLSEGDEYTAEKVVYFLRVTSNPPITKILNDDDYNKLDDIKKTGIISESEVISLLEKFK